MSTPMQKITIVVTYILLGFSLYFFSTDFALNHNLFQTWLNVWTDIHQWLLAIPAGVCSFLYTMEEMKK